ALNENGGRDIGAAGRIHIGSPVDAVVVENDRDYRQLIAANGFKFHAAETESTVTFDCNHGQAAGDGGTDGITHTNAHDAPGAGGEPFSRLVHLDDTAGKIEGIRPLVDHRGIGAPLY